MEKCASNPTTYSPTRETLFLQQVPVVLVHFGHALHITTVFLLLSILLGVTDTPGAISGLLCTLPFSNLHIRFLCFHLNCSICELHLRAHGCVRTLMRASSHSLTITFIASSHQPSMFIKATSSRQQQRASSGSFSDHWQIVKPCKKLPSLHYISLCLPL